SAGGSVTQTLELALGAIEAGAESTDAALLAADALVETGQSERAVDLLTTTLERTPPGPDAVALTVAAYEAALWQSRDLARAEACLRAVRTHVAPRGGRRAEALVVSTDTHGRLGPLLEGTQPNAHVTHLAIRSLALREHGLLAEAPRTAELAHALALESGFVHG